MLGICDDHAADGLLIPTLRELGCVLLLARFHAHTSETLSLLKNHIQQFGQLAKVWFWLNDSCVSINFLFRKFVDLKPTSMKRSSHSTGPKCIPSHTLLKVSAGGVLSQVIVLIVGRPSTLRTGRIMDNQTIRHQLRNRLVFYLVISTLLSRMFNRCCKWSMNVRPCGKSDLRWINMTNTINWVGTQLLGYLTLQGQGLSYVLK